MSQILYWTDQVGSVKHGTFVHRGGHVLLRGVPVEEVDGFKESFNQWRNDLPDVEGVTESQIAEFLESQGCGRDEGFNPPLVAFAWGAVDNEEPKSDLIADMKVDQLRKLAESLGIDHADMKKAELVEVITGKIGATVPPKPDTESEGGE